MGVNVGDGTIVQVVKVSDVASSADFVGLACSRDSAWAPRRRKGKAQKEVRFLFMAAADSVNLGSELNSIW